jgi:Protein of unknown function (DUF2380)
MNRRLLLAAACTGALICAWHPLPALAGAAESAAPPLRSLAVLDFELVDDQNNPVTKADQERRLAEATRQLTAELSQLGLYRVVDAAPSAALQRTLRSQQEYLYRCDDCAVRVGRLLSAELVAGTWVQKVSELILNVNVQIVDVAAQKVIFSKSVDLRGNDDESWRRAVHYLVRDMAEKRARNPSYGQ